MAASSHTGLARAHTHTQRLPAYQNEPATFTAVTASTLDVVAQTTSPAPAFRIAPTPDGAALHITGFDGPALGPVLFVVSE